MRKLLASIAILLCLGTHAARTAHGAEPGDLYDTHCALCHQKAGAGLAGQFPRLAGRVAAIAATPAGRTYLAEVLLFGMAGTIEVDGAPIVGVMPPFESLPDEQVAAVLNHLIALDAPGKGRRQVKRVSINAAEVHAVRTGPRFSPNEVRARRQAVPGVNTK